MNKEDYSKYYIQGSDHYLIPKDVFIELFNEMVNWREETKELNQKYLNAVADYEKTEFEKEQLNSLVNSCQEEIRQLKKQLEEIEKFKFSYRKDETKIPPIIRKQKDVEIIKNLKNQQKEFINYLESEIDRLEKTEFYIDSIQKAAIETHKHNLSKYKEIIGGK